MAEALAVIGLVSSIVQLVDFGTKIIRRLQEFTSNASDVPKTFRSIQAQLPLIIDTLERTRAQGDAGRISEKSAQALKPVIDDSLERVKFLAHTLDKAIPATDASNLQKSLKALKSLAYDKSVQDCIDRLQGNIHTLIFHQTTSHSDICDKLAQELKRLTFPSSSTTEKYAFGLNLANAPHIEEELFVGRESELRQLREWLLPRGDLSSQSVVALSGLGGVGKTQLAIKFAKQNHDNYSSTLWLNAKNEITLKQAFVALSRLVLKIEQSQTVEDNVSEDQIVMQMRQWLSEPDNNRWLLIFDNYDDPSFSGLSSSTAYDIRHFFPHCFQGSILITTRSKRLVFAKTLRLQKLESLQQSMAILASRSGRDLEKDTDAKKLAIRLDGLALALATAGAYLGQTADGCGEYLEAYESGWNDLTENADSLLEYEDRTLYSTWNLSLKQIQVLDSEAAELLRLMAYFNNQDIWYDLLKAGVDDGPSWFSNVARSRARFNRAITKLLDYSLIEAQPGSYSLHRCVHDWTLEVLNEQKDPGLYYLATCCLARNFLDDDGPQSWLVNRRLLPHAVRLGYSQFRDLALQVSPSQKYLDNLDTLGSLCRDQGKMTEAEQMYHRALVGKEKTLGPEHTSTLDTVNNLAILYSDDGFSDKDKMAKSEQMHQRAVTGYEKALGPDHISTLNMIKSLGIVYWYQGKFVEAEQMYQRVLTSKDKALGPEHLLTLATVNNLAAVYGAQGRLAEAEQMYQKVLTGWEKLLGPENTSTLTAINNLGNLYREQGRLEEAEQMCQQALTGQEKTHGLEHKVTVYTVEGLAKVYRDQGKLVEAAQMFRRALKSYEKMLGPEHPSTVLTLIDLYATLSQLDWDQKFQSDGVAMNRLTVLNELIELASKWASILVLYGDLGKVLLWNSDELNAQIALRQQIFFQDGIWVHVAMCDVCGLMITCAMKRFMCKRCRDSDLCGECLRKHETGIKELSTCIEHPFLEISSEGLYNSSEVPSVRETARELWLQKLRKEYSNTALDQRNLMV